MSAPELKPCPFCGGEAIATIALVDDQILHAYCRNHTCPGWSVSRTQPHAWNTRAADPALTAAQAEIARLTAERDAAMAGRVKPNPAPDRIDVALASLRDGWPDMVDLFMRGQCLTLAMMLRGFFPEAAIMYSRGEGHVYTDIGGRLYDIRGRHSRAPDDLAPLDFAHGDRPHRWAKRDARRLIETSRIIEPEPQPDTERAEPVAWRIQYGKDTQVIQDGWTIHLGDGCAYYRSGDIVQTQSLETGIGMLIGTPQPAQAPQARKITVQEAARQIWRDGIPPKPWRDEWFIAEKVDGERVCLISLPEGWSYDFRTADDTYIAKERIKRWMQFPDSEYIEPNCTVQEAAAVPEVKALIEAAQRAIDGGYISEAISEEKRDYTKLTTALAAMQKGG